MNILYVLHKDPEAFFGGVELHTLDLIRAFVHRANKVYLLFPSSSHLTLRAFSGGEDKEGRFKSFFCDDMALKNHVVEKSFSEILESFSIDVVHFQHLLGFPLSLIEVAKSKDIKVIISVHDYFFWCPSYKLLSPLENKGLSFCFFEKDSIKCARCLNLLGKKGIDGETVRKRREYINRLLSISDAIVVPTKYVQDIFYAIYSSLGDKIVVIEHGVKVKESLTDALRRNDSINVAYLGAFTYEKGAEKFIELVRVMNYSSELREVNFYIIGEIGYPLPGDVLKLKTLKVIGAYRRDELPELLKREGIDVILLLSLWPEAYSYTLSESIMNGVPVIATDLGALRERIAKYSVGYLVPYEDPVPRTVKIINDFLAHPELLAYFRNRCAIAKGQLNSTTEMVGKYAELYRM